jgi:hypothetical protein
MFVSRRRSRLLDVPRHARTRERKSEEHPARRQKRGSLGARVNGFEYRQLIGRYLAATYGSRGIDVYEEISLGTSTLGKTRRIDLLLLHAPSGRSLALECKFQDSAGTADEKIPYALEELRALRIPGAIVYAGSGFSDGVLHLLQSSPLAAYCLPDATLHPMSRSRRSEEIHRGTWQLDHAIAQTFAFWDVILGDRKPLRILPPVPDQVPLRLTLVESNQNEPESPIDPAPTSTSTED